jgi:DNA-binding transcriptional ArsR family regulator
LKLASFGPAQQAGVDDALAARALSHPLRVRLLELLAQAPGSPHELARGLGAPLTTVSYHVRTLKRLGFIELMETIPRRGTLEHRYRAVARVRMIIERL